MSRLLAGISGIGLVLYSASGILALSPPADKPPGDRPGVEHAETTEPYADAEDSAAGVSGCPVVVSSDPPCSEFPLGPGDIPLSHHRHNCVSLHFSGPISAPVPGREIEVRELLDGGGLGANVTGRFDFEIVGAGNTLTLTDTRDPFPPVPPLQNRTWYGVRGIGGCFDFDLQFPVLWGDADGNRWVDALDLNAIWFHRGAAEPCSRFDIDGNGSINAIDLGAAWANRSLSLPEKPSGHTCDPPP